VAEGAATALITVTRSAGSDGTVSVPVVVSSGSAARGSDFNVPVEQAAGVSVTSGTPEGADTATLTFAPGETSKSFAVNIADDGLDEFDETVNLALGTPTGTSLGTPASAVLVISDNDITPRFSINDVSVVEGDRGVVNAVFTVSMSGASSQTVAVDYRTADGTAKAGSDYKAALGRLTFYPGSPTTQTITVAVYGDTREEASEYFQMILSNAVNSEIEVYRARGVIQEVLSDDDMTSPKVAITSPRNGTVVSDLALITGVAFDNPRGIGLRSVDVTIFHTTLGFYNGSTFVGPVTPLPARISGNAFSLRTNLTQNSPALAEGNYIIVARATDALDNRRRSEVRVVVDTRAPVVAFSMPTDGANLSNLTVVSGAARDSARGSGVRVVELYLQRASDRFFFDGNAFVAAPTVLAVEFSESTGRFTRSTGLPTSSQLTAGRYVLVAKAIDRAGRIGRASVEFYVGAGTGPSGNEPATSTATRSGAGVSTVAVSSATARASTGAVVLVFDGALDAQSAGDPTRYSVTVDGESVAVESAAYAPSTATVTLGLPEGTLKPGQSVQVTWHQLSDRNGKSVEGAAGPLSVR
jgi:hypothetical protein